MKVLFITALQHLTISEHLGKGDKISSDLLITNDAVLIKNLLSSEFVKLAGMLETSYLMNSDVVVYGKIEIHDDEFIPGDYLISQMKIVSFFLNLLWLIKDNSVNFEFAYLQYSEPGGVRIDRNYFANLYSNNLGSDRITNFPE